MASHSLYRKWRSQTFSDLVGQEPVVRTLLNAVREGRLAHAYLFCGPRGTGKTSAARLLAKAVNCANPRDGEPCNECLSCREIMAGHSPDVIEIDAASNTGVDNIRELRQNANLVGSGGRYKLYIVDECFSYGELVTLADGSKMPIGKLVETQWQGEVLSYNERTGEIEPKPIVRHMRKQASAPTVRVTFDNNRSVICTINHKFYTPNGQVCAGHLKVGQFVYTHRERITQRQRAVVRGAALGDGHIGLTGSQMRARLSIRHGVAQKEYLGYKVRLLGDLVRNLPQYHDGAGTYSKTGTYRAATLSRPEIAQIHRELYSEDGRKHITRSLLDKLNELELALWYLDDGSLITVRPRYVRRDGSVAEYPNSRSTLGMYSFTGEEAQMVCAWHQERWGIESRVSLTAKGPVIWLTLAGTARLHQLIAPHVPPCMEYKLLPQYRGKFQEMTDDKATSGLAVSVVRAVAPVPMPEYVYNVEVADNHNYFVRDMLVANCHMLTVSAFNALLKTLEEPPPHIIFMLATTEAHKVLPTVVSRCQRFDFRRISLRVIVERLQQVAAGEELELEPAAADLLARAAQGGLRDALSLLDQAIAFCGSRIDLERTRAMLGLADPGALRRLILCVAEQQAAEGLGLIDELVTAGADLRQLNAQLAEELRALVLARAGADVAQMMDRTDEEARELVALAARFTLEELAACARIFARNETPARGLPVPQLALELSFLDCLSIKRSGGARPAQPAAAVTSPAPRSASAPVPALARPTTPSPPARVAQPAVEELDLAAIERDNPPMPAQWEASAQPPVATPAAPVPPAMQPPRQTPAAELPAAASAASAADGELLARARSQWTVIRRVCKQKSAKIFGLLSNARPIVMQDGTPPVMVIEADHEFHYHSLREPANREVVEWAVLQVIEATVRVRIVLAKNSSGAVGGGAADRGPSASGPSGDGPHPTIPSAPNGPNGAGGPRGASPGERGPARQSSPALGRPTAEANGSVPAASALREPANGYVSAHTAPVRTDMDPAPAVATVDLQALEAAARADAVVQELTRSQAIVLADVRPLDDDELE